MQLVLCFFKKYIFIQQKAIVHVYGVQCDISICVYSVLYYTSFGQLWSTTSFLIVHGLISRVVTVQYYFIFVSHLLYSYYSAAIFHVKIWELQEN